jgi:hypothetical protein
MIVTEGTGEAYRFLEPPTLSSVCFFLTLWSRLPEWLLLNPMTLGKQASLGLSFLFCKIRIRTFLQGHYEA